jgi:hypothetical protein
LREAGWRGSGGEDSADEVAVSKFSEEFRKIIEEGRYSLKQIFNFDGTGMFWKLFLIYVISPSVTFFLHISHKYLYCFQY